MPTRIHIQHRIAAGVEVTVLAQGVCEGSLEGISCEESCQLRAVVSSSQVVISRLFVELFSGKEEGGIRCTAMVSQFSVWCIVVTIGDLFTAVC